MPHPLRSLGPIVALALVFSTTILPSRVGAAPSAGDIQVVKSVWDYSHPTSDPSSTTTNYSGLALAAVNSAFNNNKAAICDAIKAKLTYPSGLGAPGWTAHSDHFVCNPGTPPSSLDVSFSGGAFVIVYPITGNYLEMTARTPPGLGAWADPRFSVKFNLMLTVTIPVPTQTAPLAVKSALGSISGAYVDSHNLSGDILKAFASVVAFFGGPNFQAMVQNALNSQNIDLTSFVNTALGQLNLGQVSTQGFSQLIGSTKRSGGNTAMVLLAQKPINVPTQGAQSVPVIVEWPYGSGAPTGGCAAFSASASVQVGPPSAGSPMSPAGSTGTGSGAVTQSAGQNVWQQCAFKVSGLPTGPPVKLTASLNSGWNTTKYKVIGLAPYEGGPATVTFASNTLHPVIANCVKAWSPSGGVVRSIGSCAIVFLLGVMPTGPPNSVFTPAPSPFPTRGP
jgi:hypothetical protein